MFTQYTSISYCDTLTSLTYILLSVAAMACVKSEYISSSCNRSPHCVDWGRNGFIIYGTCNAVAVASPKSPTIVIETLCGHNGQVNSVRWIRSSSASDSDEIEFVTSSTDKSAIVWDFKNLKKAAVLTGHSAKVTIASGVYIDGEKVRTLVATASVDSSVRIWQRLQGESEFACVKIISFGSGFAFDLSWAVLPATSVPMLACCGDDQKIHLYVDQDSEFVQVHRLSGHEDWIRGVELTVDDAGEVLLASCDQENFIRIWRISSRDPSQINAQTSIRNLDAKLDIKMKEDAFVFKNSGADLCYAVTLESVLQGHENWIYSIHWQHSVIKDGKRHQPMCLLSASMDKTMCLWCPDSESGVWVEQVRVGEVGGNSLGFYGGIFSPSGSAILAQGYQGAFHVWNQQEDKLTWKPGVTFGGHFSSVRDLCWDPSGTFLISSSADQTTRLHAFWKSDDEKETSWHEIVRPQVHGYDLECLCMINRFSFASGADEKVIRIFEAPRNFLENLSTLLKIDLGAAIQESHPEGASVPALGLSNKAVYAGETAADGALKATTNEQYPEVYFSPLEMKQPPTEENLLQNTLWPETQKLYGHGYEIFALACHPEGKVLASACKAAKAEHANIILWNTQTWRQIGQLTGHQLTVTQMAFSHDGRYFLTVSRDRNWCLFKERAQSEADSLYSIVACTDRKTSPHARIIWSCAWSHDDQYFATVSRDKKAVMWKCNDEKTAACGSLILPDSVTAVDFAPKLIHDKYLLAFGLDNGTISLHYFGKDNHEWTGFQQLNQSEAHHLTVKRLKFRPLTSAVPLYLASCSDDHHVKIHAIQI